MVHGMTWLVIGVLYPRERFGGADEVEGLSGQVHCGWDGVIADGS